MSSFFATFPSFRNCFFFYFCSWTSTCSNSRILRILKCIVNVNLKHFLWMFFSFQKVILHSSLFFFGNMNATLDTFLFPLCMYIKGVAYIQDELLFKKLAFWVRLKTRCASKRDALVLATLRYMVSSAVYKSGTVSIH